MFENISLSFQGIWSHKLRSLLTMLGIIIGIAAIITIVSTIKGTNDSIKASLIGAGTNTVTVELRQGDYSADLEYNALPQGVQVIDADTLAALEDLEGVEEVTAFRRRSWADSVFYRDTAFSGAVYGVDGSYFSVCGYRLSYGRLFVDRDFEDYAKVAVLDSKAVSTLFAGESPIGAVIEMFGEPFTVVGVVSKDSTADALITTPNDYWMYADTGSGTVFIPTVCWSTIYRYDEPQTVCLRASSTDEMTVAGSAVADSLTASQITNPDYAYEADDLLEQASELQALSNSTNQQLIWIAAISLLVGGIGVMNIMLVSVTERTREIGLKKALGARRRRILWQFLTEAAVLTSLGGILGVGCGIGLAQMLSSVMGTPVAISIPACVVSVAFSMVIGIVFGMVPAIKASNLSPIEALRRE